MAILFLIGFPASGKSTLAKKWAKEANYVLIDLDALIEENMGKSISAIFAEIGEEGFREVEKSTLHQICENVQSNTIIACGGGTPCFFDNHVFMKTKGKTIFIHTPFEIILERLQKERNTRPLIQALDEHEWEQKLRDLYTQRLPEYLKADEVLYP